MIDRQRLLADLQGLLKKLEADLLERSESAELPDVVRTLREEYAAAQQAERTSQSFVEWRSDSITQVAAAWVLSCVFVRFLEDNGLVETPKIAGPGERLKRARDEHELYFRSHPTLTDREYLFSVFDDVMKHAATKDIFGEHNPIRNLPNWMSGDAATELMGFFQRIAPSTGELIHDFTDPAWDTRFLGDLYQDLSEAARKRYALLQTPVFVEEFILDRTLDPAIEEFGLAKPGYEGRLGSDGRLLPDDRFKMIDPACGSGHFLLGSFARLVELWRKKEPGQRVGRILVQRALDGVHGVDLNPFAVAIARFRLMLAALKESGEVRIKDAPGFVFHLACGDSLLHGAPGGDQYTMGWTALDHVYQPEDRETLVRLLRPKSYHAVVANPPYITPKDRALNQAYRFRYQTCHMKYSLAVPFLERVMSLAIVGGYTGQITANSFMKREFGKKLIEAFFPRTDLTHVIDTSGAYIPGHGTPTVILFARNRKPVASKLRTVMGIRGEPATPNDAAKGLVWSAIIGQVDEPGSHTEFVSVGDSPRELFHKHPWSIGGGGASELQEIINEAGVNSLADITDPIGFASFPAVDEAFVAPRATLKRCSFPITLCRQYTTGDLVRDWSINQSEDDAFAPYINFDRLLPLEEGSAWVRRLWKLRSHLETIKGFGGETRKDAGDPWWSWYRWIPNKYKSPIRLLFAKIATHNQCAFSAKRDLYNQHVFVIELNTRVRDSSVDNNSGYLSLATLLNSSTACFWMKQVFHDKGSTVDSQGARQTTVAFENFREFTGTGLQKFPIPEDQPSGLAHQLYDLAQRSQSHLPYHLLRAWQSSDNMPGVSIRESFAIGKREWASIREQMITLQEEMDWECYRLYGLIDEDLSYGQEPPRIQFGGRAFEIAMGARIAAGDLQTTWFDRHHATPLPEPDPEWPQDYQDLVRRRMEVIATNTNISLIEQPEYKRRWNTEPWTEQLELALRSWLLDRLESYFDFDGRMSDDGKPTAKLPIALASVGKLGDIARQDSHFHEVGALYRDDSAFDVARLVSELVELESVPLLPVVRYKPTGLRKREEWEQTWDLQRQEDAIDARTKLPKDYSDYLPELDATALKKKQVGTIPVPPKYTNADFLKGDYWRLRGKLDVPKERWVSLPYCEGEDGTLMVAWAGYDHLQLAQAISAHYVDVQERLGGRDDPRLVPLLACIIELLPWLKQWHNDVHPEFGVPMGDYFEGFLQEESRNLGLTLDEIRAWQPPQRARGGGRGRRRANG